MRAKTKKWVTVPGGTLNDHEGKRQSLCRLREECFSLIGTEDKKLRKKQKKCKIICTCKQDFTKSKRIIKSS